jgi:hypothetical protein
MNSLSRVTHYKSSAFLLSPMRTRIFLALSLLLFSTSGWSEIYRWVDKDGKVFFSDTVPAELSKVERHVLDQQGNLRTVLRRQRTVQELEQHRLRMEAMSDEAEQREQQARYDRYLQTTFSTVDGLIALREERLEIADDSIAGMEEERLNLEAKLVREGARRSSNTVAQQTMLRGLETRMEELAQRIGVAKVLRQTEFEGLGKDIQRYEYLRLQEAMFGRGRR